MESKAVCYFWIAILIWLNILYSNKATVDKNALTIVLFYFPEMK